jgi:hypothetical protein
MKKVMIICLASILTVIGIVAIRLERERLPEKRQRFQTRQSISLKEIFEIYYAKDSLNESEFISLWIDIASILELDPEKIRPEDRFDTELAPVKGYMVEDELADLEEYFKIQCQRRGIEICHQKISTIDDFIRILTPKN